MLHAPSPGAAFSRRDFGLGKNNHSCEQNGHWSKYRGQVPAVRGCYSGGGDHGGASAAVSKMRPRPRFLEPQPRDTPVFGAPGTTQSRQPCRIEHDESRNRCCLGGGPDAFNVIVPSLPDGVSPSLELSRAASIRELGHEKPVSHGSAGWARPRGKADRGGWWARRC